MDRASQYKSSFNFVIHHMMALLEFYGRKGVKYLATSGHFSLFQHLSYFPYTLYIAQFRCNGHLLGQCPAWLTVSTPLLYGVGFVCYKTEIC